MIPLDELLDQTRAQIGELESSEKALQADVEHIRASLNTHFATIDAALDAAVDAFGA